MGWHKYDEMMFLTSRNANKYIFVCMMVSMVQPWTMSKSSVITQRTNIMMHT